MNEEAGGGRSGRCREKPPNTDIERQSGGGGTEEGVERKYSSGFYLLFLRI